MSILAYKLAAAAAAALKEQARQQGVFVIGLDSAADTGCHEHVTRGLAFCRPWCCWAYLAAMATLLSRQKPID